ncbi:Pollen receptor-like kinase 3 [Nymphaea thermarum]|nr:Pollen receptor-like kinase 3 [Nymphaea thermarum]
MAAASSILFLFLLFSWADIACSLTQADALLQLKKSVQNAGALSSWVAGGDPCSAGWRGVICFHGIVTGLRLSRLSLAGTIDVDALQQLTGLRYVSFDGNDFSGLLPAFSGAGKLKAIFLHGNRFSGAIPDDAFAGMDSLKKLWLAGNNFSGPIPSSLTSLRHLIEIRLENNAFSGKLPSFLQPSIASFNVSNNRLEGDVPPEMAAKFDSSCFSGNPGLCFNGNACQAALQNGGSSTPPPLPPPPPPMAPPSRSHKTMVLIVLVLAVLILCGLSCSSRKRQQKSGSKLEPAYGSRNSIVEQRKHMVSVPAPPHIHDEEKAEEMNASPSPARSSSPSMSPQADQVAPPPPQPQPASSSAPSTGAPELVFVRDDEGKQRSFALMDLMKAAAEVLGSGALGSSYKAVLTNGMSVVVKRMKDMNQEGKEGFREKICRLGGIKHPNILPPTAYHYRTEEKLLVYEYATHGNLLLLIHGDRGPHRTALEWPTRIKIIQGIARGMAHLHSELSDADLPHGNLKSTNVLFLDDCEPLVADYGFSPLINPTLVHQNMASFRSPEFMQFRQVCRKSDVWSLGVVILEIITGKFPSYYVNHGKGGVDLPLWVRSTIAEDRTNDVFDPEIIQDSNTVPSQISRLLEIGLLCTETSLDKRPDMAMVCNMMEEIDIDEESSFLQEQ